jgi:hypothetical protein
MQNSHSHSDVNVSHQSENKKMNSHINDFYSFVIPSLVHSQIAKIKMKDIVYLFRTEILVYDIEKRNGIVFNLADVLQCGMIGLCGMINCEDKDRDKENNIYDLWKLLDGSLNLIKTQVYTKDYKNVFNDYRTDLIDLNDILGRVKMLTKNALKEKEANNLKTFKL